MKSTNEAAEKFARDLAVELLTRFGVSGAAAEARSLDDEAEGDTFESAPATSSAWMERLRAGKKD